MSYHFWVTFNPRKILHPQTNGLHVSVYDSRHKCERNYPRLLPIGNVASNPAKTMISGNVYSLIILCLTRFIAFFSCIFSEHLEIHIPHMDFPCIFPPSNNPLDSCTQERIQNLLVGFYS